MKNDSRYPLPLLSIGYTIEQLSGIDNKQLSEDVMKNKHLRIDVNPDQTGYEDTLLPDTVESRKLLSMIDYEVKKINPYLKMLAPSETWGHILEPGQSTMYHDHDMPFWEKDRGLIDGISFTYYTKYPENSGDLVFCVETLKRRIMLPVRTTVGSLVMFPTYVPHLTLRNKSNETRISISGNYFPDPERMEDFNKEIHEGRSKYLYYVGVYSR